MAEWKPIVNGNGRFGQRSIRLAVCVAGLALALWAPRAVLAAQIVHVVQPGENLFRIGLRYGVDWHAIMAANGLYSTDIYVGQTLIIPGTTAEGAPASPPPAPNPAPPPTTGSNFYTVQRGDTLWQIARRFGITVNELIARNALINPNFIYAGQVLVISGQAGAETKVLNVAGRGQSLPLDCEARSAVDWAGYFGVSIDELEFLSRLPVSDDPDTGFVGSAHSALGQVPPASYGVHAGPVAGLLQAYGVPARAVTNMTWESVRAEIDANRPVIAWVIGAVVNGAAVEYTAASNGHVTLVAPYEHTVLVIGYSADSVTVLDGATQYRRSLAQFLASWGVLGNMAVVAP